MKRVFFLLVLALSMIAASISVSFGDTLWDYQAVDEIGFGTHPAISYPEIDPASKIVVEGVALASSSEILNPNLQYTIFIQDDTSDRGWLVVKIADL